MTAVELKTFTSLTRGRKVEKEEGTLEITKVIHAWTFSRTKNMMFVKMLCFYFY